MAGGVYLEVDGTVATVTDDLDEHDAFDDAVDAQPLEVLARLCALPRLGAGRADSRAPVSGGS